jgi:chemotaxis protein methyltransferase CheR
MPEHQDLTEIEMELLLEGIHRRYGFDFRGYARRSLKRRLLRRARAEGRESLSGLQEDVLHDPRCLERLLGELSINVTSMFRDPRFYRTFRAKVVPLLRTYPFVRIWNAGCSTGEEVYSLAILLREEGLYDRSRIYATDMNADVLDRAEAGRFPLKKMREYTGNYLRAGGKGVFSSYYTANGSSASFDRSLTENVLFARHNLVSDGPFNEFQVIVCRNVLIYFGTRLQDEVQGLFHDSLATFGVLALGTRESLARTHYRDSYEELDPAGRLYRRRG